MELWGLTPDTIYPFFLTLVRISSTVAVAPVLGSRSVPWQAKMGLAALLTLLLFPVVPAAAPPASGRLVAIGLDAGREALVGMVMGVTATLIFAGVEIAGSLLGYALGFGIINVIDPQSEIQVPILSQFQDLLAVVIFLAVDGHHLVLRALARSFTVIPLGHPAARAPLGELFARNSAEIFAIGIKLAAPALVCLIATTGALALIARTVPQMNVFIVGVPLQIMAGLATMAISLPFFQYVLRKVIGGLQGDLTRVVAALAG